ncbi:hypothetical protein [Streptomyces sp. NPDC097981]
MHTPAISACLGVHDTAETLAYYERLGFQAVPAGPDAYVRVLT